MACRVHGHPGEGGCGGGGGGGGGCCTRSALREGLLDLIQHIPKQRRLVAFSVNGHRLPRLEVTENMELDAVFTENTRISTPFTHSFDQQTDMVTLDGPAVHGGAGVDPFHNYSRTRQRRENSTAELRANIHERNITRSRFTVTETRQSTASTLRINMSLSR